MDAHLPGRIPMESVYSDPLHQRTGSPGHAGDRSQGEFPPIALPTTGVQDGPRFLRAPSSGTEAWRGGFSMRPVNTGLHRVLRKPNPSQQMIDVWA